MPSGPGVISDALIAQIARTVPVGTETFLLTSERDAEEIIAHHRRTQTTTIQLVDAVSIETLSTLRRKLPETKLIQVIHITGRTSVDEAIHVAPYVDALLLDSGRPDLPVKELGGTGRTHDWTISREICRSVEVPVYLAGGLRPENVRQAIEDVRPFGLDVCSGVRTDGILDEVKLKAYIREVRSAENLFPRDRVP
jgi:phosphoribosylanthranilate isomerase